MFIVFIIINIYNVMYTFSYHAKLVGEKRFVLGGC